MWIYFVSINQQHHYHLETCKKYRTSDPISDLWNQNPQFNKIPRWFTCAFKYEKHWSDIQDNLCPSIKWLFQSFELYKPQSIHSIFLLFLSIYSVLSNIYIYIFLIVVRTFGMSILYLELCSVILYSPTMSQIIL